MLNTGINLLPMDSNSLQKLFKTQIQISEQNILQDFPNASKHSSSFRKNLYFFEAKCRGLEVYLRYLNDYKSLTLLRDLKTKYAELLAGGIEEKKIILNKYYKEIKGSYTLQGYNELVTVLNAEGQDEMQEIIQAQYQEEFEKLRKRYEDIEKIEIIDDEVYLKTLRSDVH